MFQDRSSIVTHSGKSSLSLEENKAAFHREGNNYYQNEKVNGPNLINVTEGKMLTEVLHG